MAEIREESAAPSLEEYQQSSGYLTGPRQVRRTLYDVPAISSGMPAAHREHWKRTHKLFGIRSRSSRATVCSAANSPIASPSASAGRRQFDLRRLDGLLGTGCATINPNFYLHHGIWPGERRQCAAFPWTPPPADKIVICDVVEQVLERSSAILLRIFDLPAKLAC